MNSIKEKEQVYRDFKSDGALITLTKITNGSYDALMGF
jgi:hypothetical protein